MNKSHLNSTNCFVYQKQAETNIGLIDAWRRVQRVIYVIGNVSGKAPIVNAIFEQISYWHCRVGKSMDKYGFQEPFDIVN